MSGALQSACQTDFGLCWSRQGCQGGLPQAGWLVLEVGVEEGAGTRCVQGALSGMMKCRGMEAG